MRFGSHLGPVFDSKNKALDIENQGNPVYCRRFAWFSHIQLDSLLESVLGAPVWPQGNAKPLSLVPLGWPRADPNFVFVVLRQGPSIQGPRPGGMRVSDQIRRPTCLLAAVARRCAEPKRRAACREER